MPKISLKPILRTAALKHLLPGTIAAILLLHLLLTGSSTPAYAARQQKDNTVTLTIFHINDAHAKIDQFPWIASVIAREKKRNPNVLFLVAGDNFSGNPIVDQYDPKGQPMREILNMSRVDALALGNHEFDYGQDLLKLFIETASFPILCANVKTSTQAVIPQPKPYTILTTKGGLKVAVLGLIETGDRDGIPSTHPAKLHGLTFSDAITTARQYRFLKDQSDVFVALTHLGYETDVILANTLGELTVIIGGHTHNLIEKQVLKNNVLIAQAGDYARYLGRVDIRLKNGKVIDKVSNILKVSDLKREDKAVAARIKYFNNNPRLNQVITTLPSRIDGKPLLGNLITDAIRRENNLDVAFHNWGGTRAHWLEPTIRLKDIYSLLPFGNDIMKIEMTADEIAKLIQYDFERHERLELFVSGLTYTIIYSKTPGAGKRFESLKILDLQGKPLDKNKTYRVGINDYIVSAYEFAHRDAGKSLGITVAETLRHYLEKQHHVLEGIDKTRIRTQSQAAKE